MCQEGALGLMGDWWLEASREEAMETLSYGESGSVDAPWVKDTRIRTVAYSKKQNYSIKEGVRKKRFFFTFSKKVLN